MQSRLLRQRLKPLAAKFGITASSDLWRGFALAAYQQKIRQNESYQRWFERDVHR